MTGAGGREAQKRRAGERAAELVSDGEVVGLGTGTTAATAIRALGRRIDSGLDVRGIPTSYQSRTTARDAGIPLTTLEDVTPDIAIDGADQVAGIGGDGTANGGVGPVDLVKGGGAAHAREKLVDAAADRFVVVVDSTKPVDRLGEAVPIEVLPVAVPVVRGELSALGGKPTLRAAERKDGPVVTDNGNLVFDCAFGPIPDPGALAAELSSLPGVLEHGLFVGMADTVLIGTEDGVEVRSVERMPDDATW